MVQCFYLSTWWEYVIRTSLSLTGVINIMEAASQAHFFILDSHAFHLWMCPKLKVMVFDSYLHSELDGCLKLLFSVRQFGMS